MERVIIAIDNRPKQPEAKTTARIANVKPAKELVHGHDVYFPGFPKIVKPPFGNKKSFYYTQNTLNTLNVHRLPGQTSTPGPLGS